MSIRYVEGIRFYTTPNVAEMQFSVVGCRTVDDDVAQSKSSVSRWKRVTVTQAQGITGDLR